MTEREREREIIKPKNLRITALLHVTWENEKGLSQELIGTGKGRLEDSVGLSVL
jgi:hypothetical protein